jgi:hypothetical protein
LVDKRDFLDIAQEGKAMTHSMWRWLTAGLLLAGFLATESSVQAQYYQPYYQSYQLNRLFYYPYYFFPHNYFPVLSPQWPEPQGAPYMRPPAYMAYPAFREPGWRYELWQSQRFYRGSHFWLDQF